MAGRKGTPSNLTLELVQRPRASRTTMAGRKGTASNLALELVHRPNLSRRLLEDDKSRQLMTSISAHRAIIHGWSEQDPRWDPVQRYRRMKGYDGEFCSHFIVAMNHLDKSQFQDGGRLLRAAFLELEGLIVDGHLSGSWDICVTIPTVALNYGRKDIALTFLRYVSALAAARAPNHPLVRISRSLAALAEESGGNVEHYARTTWKIWADTLVDKLGKDNIHPLLVTRAYLFSQKKVNRQMMIKLIADYKALVAKARAEHSSDALGLEFDALYSEVRFGATGEDFVERITDLLSRVSTTEENKGKPPAAWATDGRAVYRGCWFLLAVYFEALRDDEKFKMSLRMFSESPKDNEWLQYALMLEDKLRRQGRFAEAEEVAATKREFQLTPEMNKILDEEEKEIDELAQVGGSV